jgi:hypothetical protein
MHVLETFQADYIAKISPAIEEFTDTKRAVGLPYTLE